MEYMAIRLHKNGIFADFERLISFMCSAVVGIPIGPNVELLSISILPRKSVNQLYLNQLSFYLIPLFSYCKNGPQILISC